MLERMITTAKKGDLTARRRLIAKLTQEKQLKINGCFRG